MGAGRSQAALASVRLVVFDFDQTLSLFPTCKPPRAIDWKTVPLRAVFADLSFFVHCVETLLGMGKYVGIASFGDKRIILPLLQSAYAIYRSSAFTADNVITPPDISPLWQSCYMPPAGFSKLDMIRKLQKLYGVSEPAQVLLIDDSADNVSQARANNYWAWKVPAAVSPGNGGFTQIEFFRETGQPTIVHLLPVFKRHPLHDAEGLEITEEKKGTPTGLDVKERKGTEVVSSSATTGPPFRTRYRLKAGSATARSSRQTIRKSTPK